MTDRHQAYLNSLLQIQHHEELLSAFGFSADFLRDSLKKPIQKQSPKPAREPLACTHLDTQRDFCRADAVDKLLQEIPEDWPRRTLEHEKRKRSTAGALEKAAATMTPENKSFHPLRTAHRLRLCSTSHIVFRGLDNNLLILPVMCDSPFCPQCSRVKTARQLNRINFQLGQSMRRFDLRWMTLTIRNPKAGELRAGLEKLMRAWRLLRDERSGSSWHRYVNGYLWSLEITYNKKSDSWHPHIHILYDGDFFPQEALQHDWSTKLKNLGTIGRAIVGRAYYTEQGSKRYLDKKSDPEALEKSIQAVLVEVSKYTLQPFESRIPARHVFELADCLFRRRLKGSEGTMSLVSSRRQTPWWHCVGSMTSCLDRSSKVYLGEDPKLLDAARKNQRVFLNLIRNYKLFYDIAQADNQPDAA